MKLIPDVNPLELKPASFVLDGLWPTAPGEKGRSLGYFKGKGLGDLKASHVCLMICLCCLPSEELYPEELCVITEYDLMNCLNVCHTII